MDNIRDNTYFIIAMFDLQNQAKLRKLIWDEAKKYMGKVMYTEFLSILEN
jgi:hypothetical protein